MKKIFVLMFALATCHAYGASCENGYTWNSSMQKCEITCQPGYYVATAGGTCVVFPGNNGSYYIDTSHTVAYGDVTPASVKKKCPCMTDGNCGYVPSYYNGSTYYRMNDTVTHCLVYKSGIRYTNDRNIANDINIIYISAGSDAPTHGSGYAPCYYSKTASTRYGTPVYSTCVGGSIIGACDGGFWTDTTQTDCALNNHPCNPVGVGYYSPDGDLNRYPCPDGTISGGFGAGADDISDCVPYKTFYAEGADPVQMPTVQRSEHALVVQVNNVNYYGKATTKFLLNHVHFDLGDGIVYTIINPLDEFDSHECTGYSYLTVP